MFLTDRTAAGSGRSLGRGAGPWLLALALGIVAALINTFSVNILTQETPLWGFGGALILAAFVLLGRGPGLVAALTQLLLRVVAYWGLSPAAGIGGFIYVLEALFAWYLYKRVRSLLLAVTLFWITAGWLLDLVIYVGGVGLSRDYVVLLLVKQLLNGVANAAIAELLVRKQFRDRLPASWLIEWSPMPLSSYAFQRIVVLVMLPVSLVAFQYAKVGFAGVQRDAVAGNTKLADATTFAIEGALRERRRALQAVASGVQSLDSRLSWERGSTNFLGRFEAAYAIVQVSAEGVVIAARPEAGLTGVSLIGLDLSTRRYFRHCKAEVATSFSDLVIGRYSLRSLDPEAVVTICEPLVEKGQFVGAIVAGIDPRVLLREPGLIESHPGQEITLLDRTGVIMCSDDPDHHFGVRLDSLLSIGGPGLQGGGGSLIEDIASPAEMSFFPPPSDDAESRLSINLYHASFRPVGLAGWGVLVSQPAAELHRQFLPTAYLIIGMFFTLVMFLFLTVKQFTQRISEPADAHPGLCRDRTPDYRRQGSPRLLRADQRGRQPSQGPM